MNIDQLIDRYVAVWHEPDPVARRQAIAGLWDPDGVRITEAATRHGHDALESHVTRAYEDLVRDGGFVFRAEGDATGHHDALAFTVHMVPEAGGEVAWTGRVLLILGENGLILREYQFTVDAPAEETVTRATAEAFLRRLGEGDPDRIAELFAERVEWRLDWPEEGHPAVPWIRPRSTRADVAGHFREIAAFHVPEKSAGTVSGIVVDGTEAVILGDIRQTVRATGRPYTALCAVHLTVRDGLIVRYVVYEDSLTVAEALAVPSVPSAR
ncbi:nuclear transport factor 2 family protein [Streptosporangium saharense]|uniref:nuclear transport factor 2 family protein n=1 Tax=Streptosporangium saharense TaxID=1706840 RepID=UPI003679212A